MACRLISAVNARVLQSASNAAHAKPQRRRCKGLPVQQANKGKTKDKKAQIGKMPRRGPSEADLYLLYGFAEGRER